MAELKITIKVNDTDQKILNNDLLDITKWCEDAMTGKINNCWKRMQSEWTKKLMDDESFNEGIPSDKDEFVNLVTKRSDYMSRKERESLKKVNGT